MSLVISEFKNNVCTLTINRPEKYMVSSSLNVEESGSSIILVEVLDGGGGGGGVQSGPSLTIIIPSIQG